MCPASPGETHSCTRVIVESDDGVGTGATATLGTPTDHYAAHFDQLAAAVEQNTNMIRHGVGLLVVLCVIATAWMIANLLCTNEITTAVRSIAKTQHDRDTLSHCHKDTGPGSCSSPSASQNPE